MHPSGPKSDYDWRISVMGRAQEAGIDDVGIGALFGLFDYRFEVLALLQHSQHLEEVWGVGPHTISVPRIEPAFNIPLATRLRHLFRILILRELLQFFVLPFLTLG